MTRGPRATKPVKDLEPRAPKVRDLTMVLLYLTRWTEVKLKTWPAGEPVPWRAWKGHVWGALDRLKEEGLADFSYPAKSLGLTEEGEKEARRLERTYELGERKESP